MSIMAEKILSKISERKIAITLLLLILQIILLALVFILVRTWLLKIIVPLCFVVTILAALLWQGKKISMVFVILLFITQHYVFAAANMPYAEGWDSDSFGDYSVTKHLKEVNHFRVGKVGYTEREQIYSYYPMLHLCFSTLSKITGLEIYTLGRFLLPLICTILVAWSLINIYAHLLGENNFLATLGTIIYSTCFYYEQFHSHFIRETYTFPFLLVFLLIFLKYYNRARWRLIAILIVIAVVASHHITSLVLIISLILFVIMIPNFKIKISNLNMLFLCTVLTLSWGMYMASDIFFPLIFDNLIEGYIKIFKRVALLEVSQAPLMMYNSIVERLVTLLHYLLIIGCNVLGIRIIRKKSYPYKKMLLVVILISIIGLGLSAVSRLFFTGFLSSLGYRLIIYVYIGLAIGCAIFLDQLNNKVLGRIAIVTFIYVISSGIVPQYNQYIASQDYKPSNSDYVHAASNWAKENVKPGEKIYYEAHPTYFKVADVAFALSTQGNLVDKSWAYVMLNSTTTQKGYFLVIKDSEFKDVKQISYIYGNNDIIIGKR